MTAARLITVLVVAAAVIFAIWLPGVVKGLEIFWIIASMMGIAFWMGLLWRKTTVAGAWASTLASFALWWLSTQQYFLRFVEGFSWVRNHKIILEKSAGLQMNLPWQMLLYLVGGLVIGIIVSLFSRPVPSPKLDNFYALLRTPIAPGEKVPAPCTLPAAAEVPPRRALFPNTSLEILVPGRQAMVGFSVGWALVGLFILIILTIAHL